MNQKEIRNDLSNFVFGKVQPQARDLEEAVLGAIMLEKNAYGLVNEIITAESFYVDGHQSIYQAIGELHLKSEPVDIMTVSEKLRKMGELENVGGAFYVSELTNRVASSSNIEYHAKIIQQKYLQRCLIRICSEGIKSSYEDTTDVGEMLNKVEVDIARLVGGFASEVKTEITHAVREAFEWSSTASRKGGLAGVPSYIETFDRALGGFVNGEFIIIAARPGMGKTSFALTVAKNMAERAKIPVAIFSIEMKRRELVVRMASAETSIDGERIKRGLIGAEQQSELYGAFGQIETLPIHIDDRSNLSARQMRQLARKLKAKYNIGAIIIDYLQIMSPNPEDNNQYSSRENQISGISRELKNTAKELDIPVIALSQLSRKVEERGGDKKPMLSDLRDSGALEQDADVVLFLWRPEYYGWLTDENNNSLVGLCQGICAKNRNGPTFVCNMKFEDKFSKFSTWEESIKAIQTKSNEVKSNGTGTAKAKGKGLSVVTTRPIDFSEPSTDDATEDAPF